MWHIERHATRALDNIGEPIVAWSSNESRLERPAIFKKGSQNLGPGARQRRGVAA
jgi:hypothetical protein